MSLAREPRRVGSREDLADRYDDRGREDPALDEVLDAFDEGELYLIKSRRGWWRLQWNRENNRYLDPVVWSQSRRRRMPGFAKILFEREGVEVR